MRLQNASTALIALMAIFSPVAQAAKEKNFVRVASFPIFKNSNVNKESVSEIVTATEDGNTLIYTDSSQEILGFVDIRDENNPSPAGTVKLPGEPTSVTVVGKWAIVCVNTSEDYVKTSGMMIAVHIGTQKIVRRMELGGQPDAIAISPNGNYAAIAIENERDEDLGDGEPPQAPAGFVVCLKTRGHPSRWTMKTVDMTGIDGLYPDDPEPEFVDVDKRDWAVVTMQENNHLALVNLRTCKMVRDFSAGTVDLEYVDTEENEKIEPDSELKNVPREPDAVTWVSQDPYLFATANEGDLNGGSRGFSIFNSQGDVIFDSGNDVEHITMQLGHYPEERSENKGSEPEGIEFGVFGKDELLFVGCERASVVLVYDISSKRNPVYKQTLPTGLGPEGMVAIPKRDIFVVASENDSRDDGFRSYLTIYKRVTGPPTYPTIMSADKEDGSPPITWGALSALAAHPFDSSVMYTAHDSFYIKSTIYKVEVGSPAMITEEIVLKTPENNAVDVDIEGISMTYDGTFWVATEGGGNEGDEDRPVTSRNQIHHVLYDGTIVQTVDLPNATNANQMRYGFEGVAYVPGALTGGKTYIYVCFQREWQNDPENHVRIGRYSLFEDKWTFLYYPIDEPISANGGWIGLSEIVHLGEGTEFAVIERDNQAGPDAKFKRIYSFSVADLEPLPEGEAFPVIKKKMVKNLLPDLMADNGPVQEKVEGFAVLPNGDSYIVTDNDGVDDHSGETQMINVGKLF